jgi:hypothetical protein
VLLLEAGQGLEAVAVARSTDGGLTWTPSSVPTASVVGGQPVVQPDGTVVMPIDDGFEGSVRSFVSNDAGVSFQGPFPISGITAHLVAGNLRVHELPSAEVDSTGRVYTVWNDCRFRAGCSSNDIVMSTSMDGQSWTPVVRIPIDATSSTVDHFLPGIGVEPGTGGATAHLGLLYYYYPVSSCSATTCQLRVGYIESFDGGATWTTAVKIGRPTSNTWLPLTNQGYMVGDYMSTSFVGGLAFPVFMVAQPGTCQLGQPTSCKVPSVVPSGGLTGGPGSVPVLDDPVLIQGTGFLIFSPTANLVPSNPGGTHSGSVRPDESGVIRGRTRRDSLKLTGHQALSFLVLVSPPRALTATFTASSIGSLNGTSIRSRPCS